MIRQSNKFFGNNSKTEQVGRRNNLKINSLLIGGIDDFGFKTDEKQGSWWGSKTYDTADTFFGLNGDSYTGAIDQNLTTTSDVEFKSLTIGGNEVFDANAFFRPVSSADASAPNNSVYFSTTANKLVYKDNLGNINNLF